MSIIKNIATAYKIAFQTLKNQYNGSSLTILGSNSSVFSFNNRYLESYNNCYAVSSCVMKKANAITTGKLIALDENEKSINNKYFNSARKILQQPNKYQNYNQFIKSIETFVNIYGACYIYKIKPIGFNEITGLVILPNNSITINNKNTYNYLSKDYNYIDSITINIGGMIFSIKGDDLKNVSIIYDTSINLENCQYPKSRIDLIASSVENIVNSINSRGTIISNRGLEGILSPQRGDQSSITIGLDEKERERLQNEYKKYGTMSNQWHTLISRIPMQFTKITRTPTELGLFDSENADYRVIAQTFGVPIPLLALPDTTKFNTYLEAKKEFYDDTILPEAENISYLFDNIFESEKYGYRFMLDFSHLSFMQKDMQAKANTYATISGALRENVASGLIDSSSANEILANYGL